MDKDKNTLLEQDKKRSFLKILNTQKPNIVYLIPIKSISAFEISISRDALGLV